MKDGRVTTIIVSPDFRDIVVVETVVSEGVTRKLQFYPLFIDFFFFIVIGGILCCL